ncbi:MAG: ABC transporter permease [Asgard group archaeon]|nr:ABC transporter permease [Asgard group archaeon]
MKFKKQALNGILILLILTSTCSIITSIQSDVDNEDTEQLFLISKRENNEESIKSKSITDEFGNFHFVSKISYDNNSFILFHTVNDQVNTLIIEEYEYDFFEVFAFSGGIVLFYAYHNFYGILKFHMYKWSLNSSEDIEILEFNTRLLYPKVYIFMEEDNFHLFITQMYSANPQSEDTDTTIYHYRVFLNGTCTPNNLTPSWTIQNEFDYFIDLDFVDGILYLFYVHIQDFFGFVLPERFYQTIVSSPNSTYESNFMEVDEVGFDKEFFVTEDGYIHLALAREGALYTLDYLINQSISFDMCNISDIGLANYNSFFAIKTDNNYSYIFNSEPHISAENLFKQKSVQSSIIIMTLTDVGFHREIIYLRNLPIEANYHSYHIQKIENEYWTYIHSTILTKKDIERKDIVYSNFIGFFIESTIPLEQNFDLLFHNLRVLTGFQYFWKTIGVYIIGVIGGLALIYIIFRKRINLIVRKSAKFLTKPSDRKLSKFIRIFVNIWIFISSGVTALFILFKTNKKRHFMNLIGMTILAVIVLTSINIYASKQQVITGEYINQINLINDGTPTLSWTLDFDEDLFGERIPLRTDLFNISLEEILTKIKLEQKVLSEVVSGLELSSHMHLASHESGDNSTSWNLPYLILSENYSIIFEESLVSGRLPERKGEIIFNADEANDLGLSIGDNLTSYGAFLLGIDPEFGETNVIVEIVGLYDSLTREEREYICTSNGIAYDAIAQLYPALFEGMVAFTGFGLESLEGLYPYYLGISTQIQFYYDFSQFDSALLSTLREELASLSEGNDHLFGFSSHAVWSFGNELLPVIENLDTKIQSSIFLFFILAVPILYLAIFLIVETNNIYSKNQEEEIFIFQSKGMPNSRIILNYTILKVIEALFATLFGFLISLALTPIFLKIDKFISFQNPSINTNISTVGITFIYTAVILVLVSLPKIIQISRKRRTSEKSPKRIISLLHRIRLMPIIMIAIGAVVLYSSSRLYVMLYQSLEGISSVTILMIFIYIAGLGLMLGLFGAGLLLKEFHAILMIAISKVVWKIKKSVKSFSLIEVRSDIHLFNNLFLTFFILAGIILPSIVCPISVQYNFEKDSYLRTGSDMYIFNWEDQNQSLLPDIMNLPNVESVTNITAIEGNYEGYNLNFYLINNTKDFLSTAYQPPKQLFSNWEERISEIAGTNTMLTTTYFINSMVEGQRLSFTFEDSVEGIDEEFVILGEFDYLPVFYEIGPYTGVSGRERSMIMTAQNFALIEESVSSKASYKDRLLIKLKKGAEFSRTKTTLEEEFLLDVRVAKEEIADAQFASYPFYSMIAAEFVISMLICIIAIIFISISNPIKILQHRTHKHDRLKKMGISTKRIIRLTIWETFFSGVLPGLIVGAGAGLALIYLFITTTKKYFYSGINFLYIFPPLSIILSFVVAPLLFYTIFYLSMKRNYARYMPRNIE